MLRVYDETLDFIRLLQPVLARVAKHDRSLADQVRRAAQSISLNISEGYGSTRGNRRLCYERAYGSLLETRAGLRIAEVSGYVAALSPQLLKRSDQIGGSLWNLSRR